MGGEFNSMCFCDKNDLYKITNSEIKRDTKKLSQTNNTIKSPNKNKELKNSLQFSK